MRTIKECIKLTSSKKHKHLKMIAAKMQLDLNKFKNEKELFDYLDKLKSDDLIVFGLERWGSREYKKWKNGNHWVTEECPFTNGTGIMTIETFYDFTVKRWCNRENSKTYKQFRDSLFTPESDYEISFIKSDLGQSIIKNHLKQWDKIYL